MSVDTFVKSLTLEAYKFKEELLKSLLTHETDDLKSHVETLLSQVTEEIVTLDKKNTKRVKKEKTNRPLSAYNQFIRDIIPKLKDEYPDMKNTNKMEKASELWKKMSQTEKDEYKSKALANQVEKSKVETEVKTDEQPKRVVKKVAKKTKETIDV